MKYTKKEVIQKLKDLETKLGRRPFKTDNSTLYGISRKYFGSWNKMMLEAGYVCKPFQVPNIPQKFTEEVYYFLGLLSTDGHIQAVPDRWVYRVMIYTSEKEEVEIILKLIYSLFEYNATVKERKTGFSKRQNYEIYISSKPVAEFLHHLGIPYGSKSYNLVVPSVILKNKEDIFWHYLRGVFDGDGSIIFSKHNHIFKITSGSLKFLEGLQQIMINKGFSKTKVSKQTGSTWELRINNLEDIKKIYQLIYKNATYFYPRKKLKWEKQYI